MAETASAAPTGRLPSGAEPPGGPAANLYARGAVSTGPRAELPAQVAAKLAQFVPPGVMKGLEPQSEWRLCVQGQLAEGDLLRAFSQASGVPALDDEYLEHVERFPNLTQDYLEHWQCLPVQWNERQVVLAAASPYVLASLAAQWRVAHDLQAVFFLARRSLLERLVREHYAGPAEGAGEERLDLSGDANEQTLRDLASEAPIVRLVNEMFNRAIEMDASDIHIEPAEAALQIRFRVDGVLQPVMSPPLSAYPAITSRLKLIGNLNIAERRLPQDGRTELRIGRAHIDVRISTIPTNHGESIVLRILRKDIVSYRLDNIGMPADLAARFEELIDLPHGMILVVGPTGSGKTTTLYCAMTRLNTKENKVITIEDPIEYQLEGVTQMQVKPSIGLTFADGLRHIVRQDPDIILVGEIRDRETADIAIHAALTGHLVLSTLHTNDAVGAISRLLDMGIEDFLLSSALVGVLSQRLVRKLCPDCAGSGLIEGRACRHCHGSGYRGRVGIFELLRVDESIRTAIRQNADSATLNRIAREQGMRTLREDGEIKVRERVTTAEEVARVCQLDAE